MSNLKITKEIKGKEVAEAVERIIGSGKCQAKMEASDSGEITKLTLSAGPEELEITGNSFGHGKLVVRSQIHDEDVVVRVTFTGEALLEKLRKIGAPETKDFKHPLTGNEAKEYADRVCETMQVATWQAYKLDKLTVKPTATGGQVTGTTAIAEDSLPF